MRVLLLLLLLLLLLPLLLLLVLSQGLADFADIGVSELGETGGVNFDNFFLLLVVEHGGKLADQGNQLVFLVGNNLFQAFLLLLFFPFFFLFIIIFVFSSFFLLPSFLSSFLPAPLSSFLPAPFSGKTFLLDVFLPASVGFFR